MARRRSSEESTPPRATEVAGRIRSPDDPDALHVTIRLDESRITMSTDEAEIGTWPAGAVAITQTDARTFAFVAEGDRLLFEPSDAAGFAMHPAVDATPKRGRRRAKRKVTPPSPPPQKAATAPQARKPKKKPKARKAKSLIAIPRVKRRVPKRASTPAAAAVGPAASDGTAAAGIDSGWRIRVIDFARNYSIFSLDRVPVDVSLRGKAHEHTWDHVTARASGPSHHICTVCGKFRLR